MFCNAYAFYFVYVATIFNEVNTFSVNYNLVLRIAETHKNVRNAPQYVYHTVSLAILVKRRRR